MTQPRPRHSSLARPLATMALVSALAACGTDPQGPPAPLTELPRPLTQTERAVISSSNAFAIDLLRQVAREDGGQNVFVSPLSASMALGMTANGAAGETRAEMLDVLGFGDARMADVNASYRSLIDLLRGLDRSVDFRLANAIWYQEDFPFAAEFLQTGREVFDAEVEPVSFTNPATRTRINQWVENATGGKIKEMVGELDPDLVMMLLNAIYFKGSWRDRFDPARTRDDEFVTATGPQLVPMMTSTSTDFPAEFTAAYHAVEMPYGRGAFVMTVVVPRGAATADALLEGLTPDALAKVGESSGRAGVQMPKFRLEYEKVLNGTLSALGMPSAFVDGQADFTVMSPTRGRELVITQVKQKTYVDVNEEGTEAAAATSVGVGIVSAPPVVQVDRPFLVAIRERLSGAILFIGKIERIP